MRRAGYRGKRNQLPEVVDDAGLKVDPFDVSAIAAGIGELIYNPELREELKVKGLERAKMFDWRDTARRTLKVYKQVARKCTIPQQLTDAHRYPRNARYSRQLWRV